MVIHLRASIAKHSARIKLAILFSFHSCEQDSGGDAHAVTTDVADERSVAALVEATLGRYGQLDILVNNAGINIRKPVQDLALDEWHRVLNTNLTSAFLCSRAAYPAFKAVGGGKIINIGSMMSLFGAAFAPAYGSSKGGIVQLTRSMAVELGHTGVRVNCVCPGGVDTPLTRAFRAPEGARPELLARMSSLSGRLSRPEDIAAAVAYLASDEARFVTGAAFSIDGGQSA